MTTTFQIDPETESQILSIGDEYLPTVARKVRDGEVLTDGEIAEYQEWLVGQVEPELAETDADVARLVARSISHTEIVHAEWSAALADALRAESDDSVEADDETIEFWGTTDDGGEWRVHLAGKRTE